MAMSSMRDFHQGERATRDLINKNSSARPTSSPYASEICYVHCEGDGPLCIPRQFLDQHPELSDRIYPAQPGGTANMYLGHISTDICHVLVHFLVTGTYQTLQPELSPTEDVNASDFDTALQVFAAAERLNLLDLRGLCEKELRRLSNILSVVSILDLMEAAGPTASLVSRTSVFLESRILGFLNEMSTETVGSTLDQQKSPRTMNELIFKCMLKLRVGQLDAEAGLKTERPLQEPYQADDLTLAAFFEKLMKNQPGCNEQTIHKPTSTHTQTDGQAVSLGKTSTERDPRDDYDFTFDTETRLDDSECSSQDAQNTPTTSESVPERMGTPELEAAFATLELKKAASQRITLRDAQKYDDLKTIIDERAKQRAVVEAAIAASLEAEEAVTERVEQDAERAEELRLLQDELQEWNQLEAMKQSRMRLSKRDRKRMIKRRR